jgi:hypothetical protein
VIYSKYSSRAVCLLAFLPMLLTAQRAQQNVVPLKNWPTPLYWQPNQAESKAGAKALPKDAAPRLAFPGAVSTDPLTFVAMTPCRLVDTRGSIQGFVGSDPFAGPSIAAGVSFAATFLVQSPAQSNTTAPAPCPAIPDTAVAYSLNLTVIPHAGGAVDYVQMWPAGTQQPYVATLTDLEGVIISNAAIVAAGTPYGGISLFNYGPATIDVVIDMNGYFAAPTDDSANTGIGAGALANLTSGYNNLAIGADALREDTGGNFNTASGTYAMTANTTGLDNTASGAYALNSNVGGGYNTVSGAFAMQSNTSGANNTAAGYQALFQNMIGGNNTANGYQALWGNTAGNNTAVGYQALHNNSTGANNIAVGYSAGINQYNGNSDSIYIGSVGTPTDTAGSIQIGTQSTEATGTITIGAAQTGGTIIAGISGGTPNALSNLPVCVDALGVLGTTGCNIALTPAPSSRRFKDQIADMGDSSDKLLQLRPVTFLYKPQYDDGSHALQYGLIAEEVAKLYPEMVGYDKDGQPSGIKYQSLAPMLLNELQKQAAQNRQQTEQIRLLEDRLDALEAGSPNGLGAPEPVR